ncbi:MAG: hypothetical protein FJ304_27075 [Planctomycetes bacterium]|nr:hypothetical protein [Planctomycetota bacterium]
MSKPAPNTDPVAPAGSRVWRAALRASGYVLLTVAAAGVLAWAAGAPEFLQLSAALPPLHYNGAIGFGLWGLAYLALARGAPRRARALAGALAALGVALGVGNLFGPGLRLDRWAFAPPPGSAFAPAGVPPALAALFVVAAGAVALASSRRALTASAVLLTFAGAVFVLVGPVGFVTPSATDVLGRPLKPTALGAFAVAVAGLALLASPFRNGTRLVAQ